MARLANTAAHFCQRLQELYPQKLALTNKHQSEQSSPFRRWTTGSGAGSSYRQEPRSVYNKQMSEGSAPMPEPVGSFTWAQGGVARWSLGMEQLLSDPLGTAAFAHFLAKEFAHENIRFWWSCDQYTKSVEAERRALLATEIWQRFLAEGASEPVNVDAAAKRAAALKLCQEPLPLDLFQQAQKQIFNVMKFDSYPRFLRSAVHAECARCELRGQLPPFLAKAATAFKLGNIGTLPLPLTSPSPPLPSPPPPPAHGPPGTGTPKLKKSASNASERRRSGGVSLMPWRRTASRDRAAPAPAPPSNISAPSTADCMLQVTDVVKQSAPGQCSLCRVVLPDGATSVVEVEPSVTVRRMVDRLLQRRKLACGGYGVVLKEPKQGEPPDVDASAPSTCVGGREVVVERRCVVRLDVGARAVTVRCRAARRLAHVLPPVMAKYAPNASPSAVALLENRAVPPNTSMADLDGKRLQIVELSESGDYVRTKPSDEDAESLSERALRLLEEPKEDEQIPSTSQRVQSPVSPVAGPSTSFEPVAGPSSAFDPTPGPSTAYIPALSSSSSSCVSIPGPTTLYVSVHAPSKSYSPIPGPSKSCSPIPPSKSYSPIPGPSTSYAPIPSPSKSYSPIPSTSYAPIPGTSYAPIPGPSTLYAPIPGPSTLYAPIPGPSKSYSPIPGPTSPIGPFPGPSSAPVAGPSGMGSSGRVRAALRPGPPLHHHPPDFLDNLRETQRQRLQNKNDPSPAPRTPPPLPPKPARTPTLV